MFLCHISHALQSLLTDFCGIITVNLYSRTDTLLLSCHTLPCPSLPYSLISVFTERTSHFIGFVITRLIYTFFPNSVPCVRLKPRQSVDTSRPGTARILYQLTGGQPTFSRKLHNFPDQTQYQLQQWGLLRQRIKLLFWMHWDTVLSQSGCGRKRNAFCYHFQLLS